MADVCSRGCVERIDVAILHRKTLVSAQRTFFGVPLYKRTRDQHGRIGHLRGVQTHQ